MSETKDLRPEKSPKTRFPDGPLGFLPGLFLPPLLAPPAAQIQLADHRRGLQKTPVQLHPTPDLRGLFGRHLEGFQLPFPPDGKLLLGVWCSPSAQRQLGLPQTRWRTTKEPGSISRRAPRLRTRRPRHSSSGSGGIRARLSDNYINVRTRPCQNPWKICKNAFVRKNGGKLGSIQELSTPLPTVCEIAGGGEQWGEHRPRARGGTSVPPPRWREILLRWPRPICPLALPSCEAPTRPQKASYRAACCSASFPITGNINFSPL